MVARQHLRIASWLAGIGTLVLVVRHLQPMDVMEMLRMVGFGGVLGWVALTLASRMVATDVTVRPIRALGFALGRADAFWIGWMRTFVNQIVPFSGMAYYAERMRRRVGLSWADVAALASPQVLLAATGIGLIGALAVSANLTVMGKAAVPTLLILGFITCGSLLVALNSDRLVAYLPHTMSIWLRRLGEAIGRLARYPMLVPSLIALHCAVFLLRGLRLWVLFTAAGVTLDWHEALLLIAVAEAVVLFQITPGGLGLREGAIVGASVLLQGDPEIAASVALIDRLFTLAITVIMVAPAVRQLHRGEAKEELSESVE